MDDRAKFRDLFIASATDHINILKNTLLLFQQDTYTDKTVETMHISAHSLKGECFVMDFRSLGSYITVLEKYLNSLRNGSQGIPKEKQIIVADAIEKIGIFIGEVKKNIKPEVAEELLSDLRQKLEVTDA